MRRALVGLNGLALLMLAGMSDLEIPTRIAFAAAVALNLACLVGPRALSSRAARAGAVAALAGDAAAVGLWLVLALGCGIEYFNPRCDALVTPLIEGAVGVALASLPIGRVAGLLVERSH